MAFRGHTLVWHAYMPSWFQNADANTLKNSIVDHITKVLQHYEGKIDAWDVVNEAIDDSSNGNGWKMRNSFLYQKVPNFVDLAFQTARKVSPKTKLFYNDYNTEGIYGKSESVYQFVKDMQKRGIPIDGVGIQYHVSVQSQPQYNKINDLISRYCKLGLEVHITELDVKCDNQCYAGDVQTKQAEVFSNALKACLANSCCTGYLVWGVGDNDSWLGGDKKGLLFDGSYKPKAQYNALLNILKEYKGRTTTTTTTIKKTTTTTVRPQQTSNNNCSAKILSQGYKCCSDKNCVVYYTDDDGTWGVENGQWCGCNNKTKSCRNVVGYPCCSSGAATVYTDNDGRWGVENNDWCLI
jgi:endo-1,4-beta-xylanase